MNETYRDGKLVVRADDTTRTVTEWDDKGVATSRPYTPAENTTADLALTAAATLTDLATRVARIEAHLWPPAPDPGPGDPPTTGATWDELGGVWPNGALLADSGRVWRNVSGVPLTTPPSKFPGDPGRWAHLFVAVDTPTDPGPDPNKPTPWSVGQAVAPGDVRSHGGHLWKALVAHTTHEGWAPGPASFAVWGDLGPVP